MSRNIFVQQEGERTVGYMLAIRSRDWCSPSFIFQTVERYNDPGHRRRHRPPRAIQIWIFTVRWVLLPTLSDCVYEVACMRGIE